MFTVFTKLILLLIFQAFDSSDEVVKKATAEDLIRYAKPITAATAKAVAAGNSCRQEDVISTANMGRKAIFDLLSVVKVIILNGFWSVL